MKCTHCKADLVPHEVSGTVKEGALHCYACGCCFLKDGKTPREGVPVCAQAPVEEAAPAAPEPDEDEPKRGRK